GTNLRREGPHRATAGAGVASAVVAPHAALAAAAGRAVLAEAIARAAALHTVAAAVDGAATAPASALFDILAAARIDPDCRSDVGSAPVATPGPQGRNINSWTGIAK